MFCKRDLGQYTWGFFFVKNAIQLLSAEWSLELLPVTFG